MAAAPSRDLMHMHVGDATMANWSWPMHCNVHA